MSYRRWAAALVAAAFLALPAAGSPAVAAGEPYEVYVITSQTGGMAFVGKSEVQSLQLAIDIENKAGGVQGHPIKLVVLDDQTSPQNAVQLLTQVQAKHVPVVFGSSTAGICGAMGPLLKDGPVEFCFSPAVNPAPGSYVFSLASPLSDISVAAMRFVRTKGWHKIAIISSTDATGTVTEATTMRVLQAPENAGLSVIDAQHFNPTDLSVTAQVAHIRAAGADALIVFTSGTPFATVLRALTESALDLPVIALDSNETYTQMDSYKSFLPKDLYFLGVPSLSPDVLPNGPVKRAIAEYVNTFKAAGIRVDAASGSGWDPAKIVIAALRKFGPDMTAEQLRGFIAGLRSWGGVAGDYNFVQYPQRGIAIDGVMLQRWDATKGTWVGASKLGGEAL